MTISVAEVHASDPTTYKLNEGNTYQTGCFPPCLCPVTVKQPVTGTFKLTLTSSDGLFDFYNVTDASWVTSVGDSEGRKRINMKLLSLFQASLLLLVLLAFFGCGGDSSSELPPVGFKVEFGSHNIPTQMIAGETVFADLTIKNASSRTWPSKPDPRGRNAVNLSYHWLDRKRQVVVFDGLRTPLPRDLSPGESVTLRAAIRAPEKTGEHVLHVTLVQEGVAWFSEMDGGQLSIPVSVAAASAPAPGRLNR